MGIQEMYDIRFPVCQRTGQEKKLQEITQPDNGILLYQGLTIEDVQSCFLAEEQKLSPKTPPEVVRHLKIARNLATYGYFQWEFFTVALFWSLITIEMSLRYKFIEVNGPPYTLRKKKKRQVINNPEVLFKLLFRGWRIIIPNNLDWFNGSFKHLIKWASSQNLISPNIPIYLQEIQHCFDNKFSLEILPEKAQKYNLLSSNNPTLQDIQNLWNRLSDAEKKQYGLAFTNLEILRDEIPELRNDFAHPLHNTTLVPKSAVDSYRQVIEIINSLWK